MFSKWSENIQQSVIDEKTSRRIAQYLRSRDQEVNKNETWCFYPNRASQNAKHLSPTNVSIAFDQLVNGVFIGYLIRAFRPPQHIRSMNDKCWIRRERRKTSPWNIASSVCCRADFLRITNQPFWQLIVFSVADEHAAQAGIQSM